MDVRLSDVTVEKSEFQEQKFSIGDTAMILTIVRSKIYSNPIKTVLQEISSNAQDANVENGLASTPIKVNLPTVYDMSLSIQDSGKGIPPDLMSNVFIQYGRSTKRGTSQIGGFGIGAKSPFSYTDCFNISTVTSEVDGKIQRDYQAYIDESNEGRLALLDEKTVDIETPTGTTISMPVKKDDQQKFLEEARRLFRYWKVIPKFNLSIGLERYIFSDKNVLFEGDKYKIIDIPKINHSDTNWVALVGDVPYPINKRMIEVSEPDRREFLDKNEYLRLFSFEVNEVDVSASRDDLEYNETTIKRLTEVFNKMFEETEDFLTKKYAVATDYLSAVNLWHEDRYIRANLFGDYKNFYYNEINLISKIDFGGRGSKCAIKYTADKNHATKEISYSRDTVHQIYLAGEHAYRGINQSVFHYLSESKYKKNLAYTKEFYKTHDTIHRMIVIFTDAIDSDVLNTIKSTINPPSITDINPSLSITRTRKKLKLRFKATDYYRIVKDYYGRRRRWSSYSLSFKKIDKIPDTSTNHYVIFDGKDIIKINGMPYNLSVLKELDLIVKTDNLYLVSNNIDIPIGLKSIESKFKEIIDGLKKYPLYLDKGLSFSNVLNYNWIYVDSRRFLGRLNSNSPFVKIYNDMREYENNGVSDKMELFLKLQTYIKTSFPIDYANLNIVSSSSHRKFIDKNYPALPLMSSVDRDDSETLADYINMMDNKNFPSIKTINPNW